MLMPLYRSKSRGGKLALIDWKGLEGIFSWEVDKLAIKMGDRGDKITSLSGGNQQKVLIARGFAMKPDIIVLNDPARGIDVGAKSELYRHLRDFAASGKSVVYMSSELEEFIGFATRVIVFRHGSVFDEFVGGGIEPARILEAMFGQTAGLKKSPARDGRKAPAAADEAARRAKAWAPAKEGVDNPLKAPSPRLESPVKSTRAKAPETVAKPAAPHVAEIKVVAFDGEPAATDVSPFRRREGGR
jgi:ribose transport system ATP-binding protein